MDALTKLQTSLTDRYRVLREIGTGGMATVYLARDVRHERHVALKLLKPELGAVLGVERFLSEIRVTANLQHPHLLPLFDSGEADGLLYYVMPFVEGESLRARIEREKQLPIDEAIRITVAVASALDYAHRHNVVHRDLKPENILLHDGQPLVSDFGIALAVSNAGGARITQTGLSLGTPQYMSPEQASGDRAVDARSDIYSLACVLYEMLAGEAPHTGPTVQAIIARVLTDKPRSVRESRDTVPPHIDGVLQKALAKLPADRFATAQQFADAVARPGPAPGTPGATAPITVPTPSGPAARATRIRTAVPWAVAAAGIALGVWGQLRRPAQPLTTPATQFSLDLPPGVTLVSGMVSGFEVSPVGDAILFRGFADGRTRFFLWTARDNQAREVPGVEGATGAFFSPDGRSIGFAAQGRLRTVPLSGGGATTIATVAASSAATWGRTNVIVFSRGTGYGLFSVPATGGEPTQITTPDTSRGELAHAQPFFLPDGKTFVFVKYRRSDDARLAIGSLDGRTRELGRVGLGPRYLASGHLLYSLADGSLLAAPFDAKRGVFTGPSVVLADRVRTAPTTGVGSWSSSVNGTIVIDRGTSLSRLTLVDRAGRVQRLSDEAREFRLPRFSPDGGRIALQLIKEGSDAASDIWLFDRRTSTLTRFTSGGGHTDPIWSPDGRRLAFSDNKSGNVDIHWQLADGGSAPEPLLTGPGNQWPWSFTPDGKTVVYDELADGRPTRIMARTLGDTVSRAIAESEFNNRLGKLSPNGKWLAYTSNETGRLEVYVRPFPGPGGKQQISIAGGDQPLWSRDGTELFYRTATRFVAAALQIGSDIAVRSRIELFEDVFETSNATDYDVSPDGKSFLMLQRVENTRQITVMVNWLDEIKRRTSTQPNR